MKEVDMVRASKSQMDKIEHPQAHYNTPDDLIKDPKPFSQREKEGP
jgi:hypothetical protein